MNSLPEIEPELARIETDESVRIIYACESGSRAWGFPSTDSDYDVRFIYAHPAEWYLSVQTRRDVIERPLDNLIDRHALVQVFQGRLHDHPGIDGAAQAAAAPGDGHAGGPARDGQARHLLGILRDIRAIHGLVAGKPTHRFQPPPEFRGHLQVLLSLEARPLGRGRPLFTVSPVTTGGAPRVTTFAISESALSAVTALMARIRYAYSRSSPRLPGSPPPSR